MCIQIDIEIDNTNIKSVIFIVKQFLLQNILSIS